MAIRSFGSKATEQFFRSGVVSRKAGWASVATVVARKLDMVHYASELRDLRSPPANRLGALKGRLRGFYSIRVNDQWRVVFRWSPAGPTEVDVVDYH